MTTYLTRLEFKPGSPMGATVYRNARQSHILTSGLFPETPEGRTPRQEFNLLYRWEEGQDGKRHLLLQSTGVMPNKNALPRDPLVTSETKSLDALLAKLSAGTPVAYRLEANPTVSASWNTDTGKARLTAEAERLSMGKKKPTAFRQEWLDKVKAKAGRRGIQLPLFGDDAEAWWLSKAPKLGLSLREGQYRRVNLEGKPPKAGVALHPFLYSGNAVVEDADALREAVTTGVGPAKAYGLGLLSLAPLG